MENTDQTIAVIARFTPSPGHGELVNEVLNGMVSPTRAEPGCLKYDLFAVSGDTPGYVLLEQYRDQAALEAHRATEHYTAYRARIAEFLASPIDVTLIAPIDVA